MIEASTAPATSSRAASASPAAAPKQSAAPAKAAKKKPVAKPASKATAKAAAKASTKAAAKPAAKPAVKATKPSAKPAPKAAAVAPASQAAASHNGSGKQKLVRDSFTMPSNDFGLIHTLKERAITFRRPAKKSELLRAGLHALAALNDAKLKSVLDGLAPLKSGRPKKAG